jgi:hypothetical protein
MGFSLVNGAPPKETPLVDSRARVTAPWFAFLTSLQKSNSGVVVGLGGVNLNGQNLTGSATFSGAVVFGVAPSFTDAAGTRNNLGLGSAALQPSSAFDVAGAATAGQAAAIAASLQRASNLSDLANAATARTNLGLGSAATQNTTAFDAAGAASAAVAALLASANTWNGTPQIFNSDMTIWGQVTLGYAMNWAGAQIFGTAKFSNDMLFPFSNGFWYASPNATSWYSFRSITSQGAAIANDYFGYQYNQRSTAGAADSWRDAFQIAALTGGITFFSSVSFAAAATFSAGVTFSAPASVTIGSGWLAWAPTLTAFGSMTVSSVSLTDAQYLRVGPWVFCKLYASFTLGGTASNVIFATLPAAVAGGISGLTYALKGAGSTWAAHWGFVDPSGNFLKLQVNGEGNFTLGSTQVLISFFYRCA